MNETANGLMTGANYQANSGGGVMQGAQVAIEGAGLLIGQMLANRDIQHLDISYNDVVAEDISRDNRSYIVAGASVLLTILVLIVLTRK